MPALGAAQDTGTLLDWLKQEGESVTSGEPLMLVETDKSTVELEAPATGTLAAVTAAEGDQVPVGTVIAQILGPGESLPPESDLDASDPVDEPPSPDESRRPTSESPSAPPGASSPHVSDQRKATGAATRVQASPKVRRLAREQGIDLATVRGSGPDGAILSEDLDPASNSSGEAGERTAADRRDGSVWRAMASNVTRSWQAVPHFYLVRDVRAAALMAAVEHAGPPTTYTDLLIAVLARTLRDHPAMVAASTPDGIDIGVAVGTQDGLYVPVVHGADRLSLGQITELRRDLVQRVRIRQHTVRDMTGAAFTLSNLGMYGVDSFQAIVIDGQTGILAVGRITERVIVSDGHPAVAPALTLCLSLDHRLVDGMRAAEFFSALANQLEDASALADTQGLVVKAATS